MGKTVSILGLGWLGLPLAKSLLQSGFQVKGSVSSAEKLPDLDGAGIRTSVIKIEEASLEVTDPDFFSTDILYINFPPRRIQNIETVYPGQVQQLLPYIHQNKIQKVIFISSTSVYPEVNRSVTETETEAPQKGSGVACLAAEKVLQNDEAFQTTVIRFGGLIGANRNPHRFMERGVRNGAGLKPVNLIHQDDCIGIVKHVIENDIWSEVINGCSPEHPTRKAFYTLAAKAARVEPPVFDEDNSFQFKTVSSNKLIHQLGYEFIYPSPMDYLQTFIR